MKYVYEGLSLGWCMASLLIFAAPAPAGVSVVSTHDIAGGLACAIIGVAMAVLASGRRG